MTVMPPAAKAPLAPPCGPVRLCVTAPPGAGKRRCGAKTCPAGLCDRRLCAMPAGQEMTIRGFKYRLDPSPRQARQFERYAGGRRFAMNWAVSVYRDLRLARAQGYDLIRDLPDAERTARAKDLPSYPRFSETNPAFNARKTEAILRTRAAAVEAGLDPGKMPRLSQQVAPPWAPDVPDWVLELPSEVFLWALYEADDALSDHLASYKKGRFVGFPRFKSRKRDQQRFKVTGSTTMVRDRTHVRLPKVGVVHTRDNMKPLHTLIKAGRAIPKTATVSKDGRGNWWIALSVEVQADKGRPTRRQRDNGAVAVHLGVNTLAALSNGVLIANPAHTERHLDRLRVLSRRLSRSKKGSRRSKRLGTTIRELHYQVAAQRSDHLHKITGCLVRSHDQIAVQQYNLAAMVSKDQRRKRQKKTGDRLPPNLARRVHDAGLAEFVRQIGYKGPWNGCAVTILDPTTPVSYLCSDCGRDSNPPRRTDYTCEHCGATRHWEINSARNTHIAAGWGRPQTAHLGQAWRPRKPPESLGRPGQQPSKRKPGTATPPLATAAASPHGGGG